MKTHSPITYKISRSLNHLSPNELQEIYQTGRVNLGWWNLPYADSKALLLSECADGYCRTARDLLDGFCSKTVYSDAEALPILYLVFHFIELSLKALIEAKLQMLKALGRPRQGPTKNHNIAQLLDFLADLFEPKEEFISHETQEFIRKMGELNGRSAQVFRYPFDKQENIHLNDRPVLSMGVLKAEFEIHGAELDGFRERLTSHLLATTGLAGDRQP